MFINTDSGEVVVITNSYISGNHAVNGGAFCKLKFRLFLAFVRLSGFSSARVVPYHSFMNRIVTRLLTCLCRSLSSSYETNRRHYW